MFRQFSYNGCQLHITQIKCASYSITPAARNKPHLLMAHKIVRNLISAAVQWLLCGVSVLYFQRQRAASHVSFIQLVVVCLFSGLFIPVHLRLFRMPFNWPHNVRQINHSSNHKPLNGHFAACYCQCPIQRCVLYPSSHFSSFHSVAVSFTRQSSDSPSWHAMIRLVLGKRRFTYGKSSKTSTRNASRTR